MWNSAELQIVTAVTLKYPVLCNVIPLNLLEPECNLMIKMHLQSTKWEQYSVDLDY